MLRAVLSCCLFFFFNDSATTDIYTLSLHDALPILYFDVTCTGQNAGDGVWSYAYIVASRDTTSNEPEKVAFVELNDTSGDRKSTRLNSSYVRISYAVFCLKKKKKRKTSKS